MHFLMMLPAVRLLRVPVIYRLGDAPQQHRPLFQFLWRHVIISQVDRFVCVSGYIRDLLIEAGAPPEKVRVIYSYPSKRSPDLAPVPIPAASFDGRTVAYMGQITKDKGVEVLVEAAIALCGERDDVRFLVAGDYSWQNPFAEALIQRVEDLGLSQRIMFLGYVEDIPGLLAVADLHLCPSVSTEALSNTVVEAKQAGVPSVVFPSGGLPELVVEQGNDGFVCDARTAGALVAGLRHYLDLSEGELIAAKAAAKASLPALGITREAFSQAWEAVYDSV